MQRSLILVPRSGLKINHFKTSAEQPKIVGIVRFGYREAHEQVLLRCTSGVCVCVLLGLCVCNGVFV